MTKRSWQHLLKLSLITSAALLALAARADLRERADNDRQGNGHGDGDWGKGEHGGDDDWRKGGHGDDDDRRDHKRLVRLATGQFISPTFVDGAFQQYLNPGLTDYPSFIAGEAVRSQLSPDGTTLQHHRRPDSLYKPDGRLVPPTRRNTSSYDVKAQSPGRARPGDQTGERPCRAVFSQMATRSTPRAATTTRLCSARAAAVTAARRSLWATSLRRTGTRPQQRRWPQRAAQRQRHQHLRRRPYAGRRQQLQRLHQRHRYRDAPVRYEHDLRPFFANNEGTNGAPAHLPFAVVVKDNGTAYVSSDRDREVVVVDDSAAAGGHMINRIK